MRKQRVVGAAAAALVAAVVVAPVVPAAAAGDVFDCSSSARQVYQVQPFQHRFRVGTRVVRVCDGAPGWLHRQSWTNWNGWVRF
jgi:hypothetical protein